ncbi:hypothetical protein [Ancylobacter lacus]|uniref:hypothetical protein n=1 Tax=Ancylobacter lacus TaxID=2579970 RepID=UPI001BCAE7EB|nr:hypothetical protein [Ancylobacter lacus]MBS7538431.1 hypothetical protein [Ancylobacter lacus]
MVAALLLGGLAPAQAGNGRDIAAGIAAAAAAGVVGAAVGAAITPQPDYDPDLYPAPPPPPPPPAALGPQRAPRAFSPDPSVICYPAQQACYDASGAFSARWSWRIYGAANAGPTQ